MTHQDDLATLREALGVLCECAGRYRPGQHLDGCRYVAALAALDRLEAELARLTARRSRYAEARYENCMEALSAAEARCARLQQALADTRRALEFIAEKIEAGDYGAALSRALAAGGACVCGEINTRHCPVHGEGTGPTEEA